jgi:hypothetical protein
MLNPAVRGYRRLRDPSILDSVPQRGGARPGDALDDDQQVRKSANTESAIQSYATARNPDEMSHWLNKIVESWRADNAAAGLSVLDHKPLPRDAGDRVAEALWSAPERDRQAALSGILARSDPGVKLHVAAQLNDLLATHADMQPPSTEIEARDFRLEQRTNAVRSSANGFEPNTRPQLPEQVRGQLNATGSGASPLALAGRNDMSPTAKRQGDDPIRERTDARVGAHNHGPHRTRRDDLLWTLDADTSDHPEFIREPYVDDGSAKMRPVLWPLVMWVARERGTKALKSAGYSVAADIVVTVAAKKELPSLESMLASALTGAGSGVVDFGPDQWKYEAGLAVMGSVAEDVLKGEKANAWAAIGAGVGAGLYAKYGKERFKARFGEVPVAQMTGKAIKKLIQEVFGTEVEVLAREAEEFIKGFLRGIASGANSSVDYLKQQFNDWLWQGDTDPATKIVT